MGGKAKKLDIRKLVSHNCPDLVCIQETKLEKIDRRICSSLWGSDEFDFVFKESDGKSGGLLSIWDAKSFKLISSMCLNYAQIINGIWLKDNVQVVIVNVYAPCDLKNKVECWNEILCALNVYKDGLICLMGDFNSIRSDSERKGAEGNTRNLEIDAFNKFIMSGGFVDLPMDAKMLEGGGGYQEFVRQKWKDFKVEGWGGYVLKEKFKAIKKELKEWHKNHCSNLDEKILKMKEKLNNLDLQCQETEIEANVIQERAEVMEKLFKLADLNCSIKWQKARVQWIKEGDANSRFFHNCVNSRRRLNDIHCIEKEGVLIEDMKDIKKEIFNHFKAQFQKKGLKRPKMENFSFKKIDEAESNMLVEKFTEEEIKQAVWDCENMKSPGPDGVSFGFIKDFWEDVKGDIFRFMTEFHEKGKLVKGINSTFIALIPKKDNPSKLNDFRPISLVGCAYKILSKVLANRLKKVMHNIISGVQTAFVQGRQILDGVLIANEVIEEAKRLNREVVFFKVDFEKAYDSVDWDFLEFVMRKMNFPWKWRKWIRESTSTAMVSVLINGSPTKEFIMERGLRQGDPLSPFLFLMVAEGFNVLMQKVIMDREFEGYGVGRDEELTISHLQFADDTLVIGKRSWANIFTVKAILQLFEIISGLKVNFHKSELIGINVDDSWLKDAASVLNCKVGSLPFYYLGLPIGADPRKIRTWEPVINSLRKRLLSWKNRALSMGGRLVLLKSVLTALPIYFLSFFKAPSGIISLIESLFKNFLWGGSEEAKKIHWENGGGGLEMRKNRYGIKL
ncbi:cysteine-rich receptor-like protein kinase [Trifolium medium]|uniref:Cysteine-rich receptor-like protein kinase n=1 Tax=Trifolium medium TaxID=97028 RepID=A0A392LYY8_9FABA|nr:cysteine-rich receptor-like protein kinase [Trifolium medium]